MAKLFAEDERGAVAADWVTLTAGILALGIVVVYTVMGNSAGYLMDEFDDLNKQYEVRASDIDSVNLASSNTNSSVRGLQTSSSARGLQDDR